MIKNKNSNAINVTRQLGLALMTIAALVGLVETSERPFKAVLTTNFAVNSEVGEANPIRREREEAGPHYISYSASQRTPGRTGRY